VTSLAPALFAVLLWWASTGAVLLALRWASRAPRLAGAASAAVFAGGLALVAGTAGETSAAGAYLAFTAAIAVWGVQELAFLAGWITGPWRSPAPAGTGPLRLAGYAVAAILYHELALVASGALVLAASWGGPNQLAFWTFAALLVMRVSAKLNVFLGVSNLAESFLPAHLAYLKSFFGARPINLLFPVSVGLSALALAEILIWAGEAEGEAAVAPLLLGTLVALGFLEHWLLVLPVPVERLWGWGARPAVAGPLPRLAGAAAAVAPDFEPIRATARERQPKAREAA